MMMQGISGGGDLPAGYTRYDWIASDGVAYIDTGIIPTYDTKWHFKVDLTEKVYHTEEMGTCRVNSERFHFGQKAWGSDTGIGSQTGDSFRWDQIALPLIVDMYGSGRVVRNNHEGQINSSIDRKFTVSITLFGRHISATNISDKGTRFKLYEHSITEGTEELQNFIPCTNPDGDAGFYDTISQTFFGNAASSGSLIAGNDT